MLQWQQTLRQTKPTAITVARPMFGAYINERDIQNSPEIDPTSQGNLRGFLMGIWKKLRNKYKATYYAGTWLKWYKEKKLKRIDYDKTVHGSRN